MGCGSLGVLNPCTRLLGFTMRVIVHHLNNLLGLDHYETTEEEGYLSAYQSCERFDFVAHNGRHHIEKPPKRGFYGMNVFSGKGKDTVARMQDNVRQLSDRQKITESQGPVLEHLPKAEIEIGTSSPRQDPRVRKLETEFLKWCSKEGNRIAISNHGVLATLDKAHILDGLRVDIVRIGLNPGLVVTSSSNGKVIRLGMAWIRVRTHLIRVRLGDNMTEHISIKFANIPLCFDFVIPLTFEEEDFNRPSSLDWR
ncbi:hypothetical protein FIBSPDRAFT_905353 [Athelia psychrophila]|uniref:Uncharacterized protein n=1 Tax=Athelia psychrophila TaxID=1759441 RepID=A0A167TJ10_9AGAM|nr:hypothetical protein FIBSPDRAFT_905353 [Fibularhizoctonia sp. CBS 109695]